MNEQNLDMLIDEYKTMLRMLQKDGVSKDAKWYDTVEHMIDIKCIMTAIEALERFKGMII